MGRHRVLQNIADLDFIRLYLFWTQIAFTFAGLLHIGLSVTYWPAVQKQRARSVYATRVGAENIKAVVKPITAQSSIPTHQAADNGTGNYTTAD